MTVVTVSTTARENAILGMNAVLRDRTETMMAATWVFAELAHAVRLSGVEARDFPRPFRDLYYEAKERGGPESDGSPKKNPGFGFLVKGLRRTMDASLRMLILERQEHLEALTESPEES